MALPSSSIDKEAQKFIEDDSGNVAVRIKASDDAPTLPDGASTEDKQDDIITELGVINSLVPDAYDYIALSYTGTDLTGVVFKTGGASGTTVSTLTLAYTANVLQSVTKS